MPPYNAEATLSAGADSEEINSPDIAKSTRLFKVNSSPNNRFAANTEPASNAALLPNQLPCFIFFSILISKPSE